MSVKYKSHSKVPIQNNFNYETINNLNSNIQENNIPKDVPNQEINIPKDVSNQENNIPKDVSNQENNILQSQLYSNYSNQNMPIQLSNSY
jgi:hypothetical protein